MEPDRDDISQEPAASTSEYNADEAIANVMTAVSDIRSQVKTLGITSRYADVDDLESIIVHNRYERVVIAICGATGAGKSTLINAVLDDEIVPTSSTAACTSVVTRIHFSPTGEYRAQVHFLARAEWVNELEALVADVADSQSGNGDSELAAASGFLGEVAKPAWDKFHAVYPDIPLQELARLKVDDLLEDYPAVTKSLDQTLSIFSETPEGFSAEMRDYLETSQDGENKIAYWALICHVDIFCPAAALKTGAVLVDLPGVADSNSARNAIAQKFMEQSHHFWIVAPVQRAVDDRTALDLLGKAWKTQLRLDGNLNPESITYIATKCDGFRVAEVVKSLGLSDRPKYQRLSQEVARRAQLLKDAEKAHSESSNALKDIEKSLNEKKARVAELQSFLQVSGTGGAAAPDQTKPTQLRTGQASSSTRKRKEVTSTVNPKDGAARNKRARTAISEAQPATSVMPSRTDAEKEIAALEGEIMRERIASIKYYIAQSDTGKARKETEDAYTLSQKELHTYCHRARTEFLEKHIQASFRDDTADHTQSDMDLPVFAVSSREYARHTGQISDETPEFISIEDTGIPALQRQCHTLTLPGREDDAKKATSKLKTRVVSLHTFYKDAPNVAEADRESLRAQWESIIFEGSWEDEEYFKDSDLLSPDEALWEQKGVVWRLIKAFDELTQGCGRDLQEHFKQCLSARCKEAAELAADRAYAISKEFASDRVWQTYRAVLRRDGQYGPAHDLNAELAIPFAVHIASSWRDLFSANLFGKLEEDVMRAIDDLVDEFVQGVPAYLKQRAQQQADSCRQEARSALSTVMFVIACELNSEQKKISRSIAPHVRGALLQVYKDAMLIKGTGTTDRQKQYVHDSIHKKRDDLFGDAASALMKRLEVAPNAIAQSVRPALQKIARKAEINLAVLWEKHFDDDEDGEAREQLLALLDTVLDDLNRMERARELRDANPTRPGDDDGDDGTSDDDEDDVTQDDDDDIASGEDELDLEGEDATMEEDDGHDQAECETGSREDGSVEDAVVDEETGGAVSSESEHVADVQGKLPADDADVIMDVAPTRPGDKGTSDGIKVEVKMEDIVPDGSETSSSIGKDA